MTVVGAESRFHVLAVDDSVIDRKLIEMLLRTSSYQVTTVDSGSKALELLGLRGDRDDASSPSSSSTDLQETDVNLIITDYCMPGMTGYDLLKRVKGSSSLKDIPVVIMSSENVPARINRCLEDGADEFFLKPVKLADMKKLKSHLLRRKQPQLPEQAATALHKPQLKLPEQAAAALQKPQLKLPEQAAALHKPQLPEQAAALHEPRPQLPEQAAAAPQEAAEAAAATVTAVEAEVVATDGGVSECCKKRKTAAGTELHVSSVAVSPPERTKPRLSGSSLAVET